MSARIPRLYGSVAPDPPNILIAIARIVNCGSRPVVEIPFAAADDLRHFFQFQWDFKRRLYDAFAREKIVSIATYIYPGVTKFQDLFPEDSFTVSLPYGRLTNWGIPTVSFEKWIEPRSHTYTHMHTYACTLYLIYIKTPF